MHPSHFGPYRVVRLIGQGGMGTVYEAIDPATGRTVAVKTLPLHLANDDTIRRRFESEKKTLLKLSHPCIVHIQSWGEQEGLPFFVMDYVPGLTLEALLRVEVRRGAGGRRGGERRTARRCGGRGPRPQSAR